MPTSLVTGGAGFLAPPLRGAPREGAPGDLPRQPRDGLPREHRAPPRRRIRVRPAGSDPARRDHRADRLRLSPREPGEPDRLPAAPAADAQGRLARTHNALGLAKVHRRASCSPRRARSTATRRYPQPGPTGATSTRSAARRVRRGEALCRGVDHGLPPPAGRRHGDRPDLQHLRLAHAPARRSGDPHLPPPGARGEAAHSLRRRVADAELLLRGRPGPRPDPARRASTCRSTSATPRREPARARRGGRRRHGLVQPDRVRGPAGRRSAGAAAGHHASEAAPRLGAGDHARGRSAPHLASLGRDPARA